MRMTRDEFNHISAGLRGRLTALAGRFGESALLPLSAEDVVQEALAALWQLSEKNYPIRDYEAMAVYYVFNAPDEDEREFAMLLRISLSGNILSEETADEFDRLVCMPSDRPAGKKRRVSGIWIAACLACAASLALFLILRNPDAGINVAGESGFAETFSVVEFTDCIEKMAAVCGESVASVSVNPVGNAAIMIVNLKDNSSMKYLVTCNDDDGYASFIALGRQ